MSIPVSSLPDRWVQRIWGAMRATYGASFDRMWPCPPCPAGVDPAKHAADHTSVLLGHWAKELGRFQSNPSALQFGLSNLPANPPNLIEFKAICGRAPRANDHLSLPAPEVSREGLARVQQKLANGLGGALDPMDPVRRIMLRELDGDKSVNLAQREFWRQALRSELLRSTGIDVSEKFAEEELRAAVSNAPAYAMEA